MTPLFGKLKETRQELPYKSVGVSRVSLSANKKNETVDMRTTVFTSTKGKINIHKLYCCPIHVPEVLNVQMNKIFFVSFNFFRNMVPAINKNN